MDETVLRNLKPLILILQYNDINININSLVHKYNLNERNEITSKDYKIICKGLKIKCKSFQLTNKELKDLLTPFVFVQKDGKMNIAIQMKDDQLIYLDLDDEKPKTMKIINFKDINTGEIIIFKKIGFMSAQEKFGFSWFLKAILKYKSALIQVLIAYFIIQIISLFTPVFIQFILDKVLTTGNLSTLYVLSAMILFALFFEMILTLAKDYVFHFTTNRIDMMLNSKIIKHLFALPIAYFEKRRVGDTVARIREVENIRTFLTGTPLIAILDVLFVFVYIFIMFFYSKTLSFVILAIVPLIILIYSFATPIFKKRLDKKYYDGAELQSFIVESMNGIHTIKSFALEPKMDEKWENIAAEYINTSFKTKKLVFIINDVVSFLQKTQDIIVIAIGAILVIRNNLTIGELVAFRMIASRITSPLLRFVQMWQDYQQMNLSVKRVSDIFMNPIEYTEENTFSSELPNLKGSIRFENVDFRYNINQPLVLNKVSFSIEPNQVIGVIGRSGSGKSTLSKLMQRLYVPESGKIYFDDIDTSNIDPFWLRRQIGVVLQENFIFNGTVKENIAISNPSVTHDLIEKVCKISGAHGFIMDLEKGYNTLIGEKGVGVSGGQKQRLAIARALINDPKILIFDEATSALDYESESIIQENLKQICQGRTVIIIAHRLSTLKDCDYIMSIDKGEVIEFGKPINLMKNENSFYKYLKEKQGGI